MNKELALDLIKLLSALESWGFLEGKRLPDYLFDQISDRVCELSKIILEGE